MSIQQLCCTHCTYGSSALERNAGELANRTLGYSARAGSIEGEALRQCYRQTERYVYYHPPRDTPAEAKLGLSAASAPQRLVFAPAVDQRQMLAQVCYRATDCEGRPGSYFAHVLLRDEGDGQAPWSPLQAARLWGAPGWICEDSPAIPHRLPPLATLDDLLGGREPPVEDRLLVSFLSAPAGGAMNDPGGVIPPRWQRLDPVFRRQAFAEAFDALIEIGTLGQPSLLLVIEPSLAALFFYGMLRLLPAGPLRDTLSFSTFEPEPDRLCTTLAATWFFDPARAAVPADGFGVRGIVVNTLDNRPAAQPRRQSAYVHAMIDRLVGAGWYSVDCTLEDLQAVEAGSIAEIERLTAVESVAQSLLAGRELLQGFDWRRSPQDVAYLRRSVARDLFSRRDITPTLGKLVGKPAHLIVLELLSGEADDSGARPAVEYLLQRLPDEQFGALVRLESVLAQFKLDVLARRVTFHGKVPPGCEWLWEGGELLPRLLARLDPDTVERFCGNTAEQYRAAFLVALLQARRLPGPGSKALKPVAELLPAAGVADVHRIAGDAFFAQYPADEPTLGRKMHEMLATLPEAGDAFSARLDALLAGKDQLPSGRDYRTVECWDACRRAIMEIGALQGQQPGAISPPVRESMEAACRKMAEAVAEALPDDAVNDEDEIVGADRLGCLHAVGRGLLGQDLLPSGVGEHDALWGKIAQYFDEGQWPAMPIAKTVPQPPPPPPSMAAARPFPGAAHGRKPPAKKNKSRAGLYVALGSLAGILVIGLLFAAMRGDGKRGTPEDEKTVASKTKPPDEPPAKTVHTPPQKTEKTTPPEKTVEKTPEKPPEKTPAKPPEKKPVIPPEEEPKKPPKEPPEPPKPNEHQQWLDRARESAKKKKGVLLTKPEMQDGQARLDEEELEKLKSPTELRLGLGKLRVGDRFVEFGRDFANDSAKPVSRQRLPKEDAEKLFGFNSVWVEIQEHEGGFRLIVEPRREDGEELLPLAPDTKAAQKEVREQIAAKCTSISAVVYPPAAPPKSKPEPEPGPPAGLADVREMKGTFKLLASKERVEPEGVFTARLRFQMRQQNGAVLPAWFWQTFTVKCHAQRYLTAGREPSDVLVFERTGPKSAAKATPPPSLSAPMTIPSEPKKVECRFVVYAVRSGGQGQDDKEVAVAQSESYVLPEIEHAKEYIVQFRIDNRAMEEIKLASGREPPAAK